MFDPQKFINQGVGFAMPDAYPLVPEGDYPATCVDYKVVPPDGDRSPLLEVYWKLDNVQAGPRKQGVWLDVDAAGNLLEGGDVNIALGMLRTSLGQNVAGQPWSPEMLRNQRALVHVKHKGKYDNVDRVASLRTAQAGVPGQAGPPVQAPTTPLMGPPGAPPWQSGAPPAPPPPGVQTPPVSTPGYIQPPAPTAPQPAAAPQVPWQDQPVPKPVQAPTGQPPAAPAPQPAATAPAWGQPPTQ